MRELDRLLRDAGRLLEKRESNPELLRELARYADDPVGFAVDVLGLELWNTGGRAPDQAAIFRLPLEHRHATVVAAHSVGKSFGLAALALWWAYARAGAVIVVCPVDAQLRSLFRDLRTDFFEAKVALPGELLEQAVRVSDSPPVFIIGRTTTSGAKLKGLHGRQPLLTILDEADAVEEAGTDIWEKALTLGGGDADRLVAAGNPTACLGIWYDRACDPQWGHVQLSALDHPNVVEGRAVLPTKISRAWVEEMARLHGEDSPAFAMQVRGEFSEDIVERLVLAGWLDRAYQQHDTGELLAAASDARLRVGIDPSWGGTDRTAICVAQGGHVLELTAWHAKDTTVTLAKLVEVLLRHNVARDEDHQPRERGAGREAVIVIDAMGGGKPLHDQLREAGWPVEPFFSNGAPTLSGFANARAQAYGTLAELLRAGKVGLPRDSDLAAELLAPHQLWTTRGTMAIESKPDLRSRLGRSPDLGDAVAMAIGTAEPDECTVGGLPLSF